MQGGVATQTLLLSQSYEPIKVISWQRAFTLLTLGKVEVLEEYSQDVRTVSLVFKVPAVCPVAALLPAPQEAGQVLASEYLRA